MNVQNIFFVATDPALESSLGACLATVIFTIFTHACRRDTIKGIRYD
jgi:uncharacterized MnhB-related membrane protein